MLKIAPKLSKVADPTYSNNGNFLNVVGEASRLIFRILLSHVVIRGRHLKFCCLFSCEERNSGDNLDEQTSILIELIYIFLGQVRDGVSSSG